MECVGASPVGHPRHSLRTVRPIWGAPHILRLILEVYVVESRDSLMTRCTGNNRDRTVDNGGTLISGNGVVSKIDLKPLLTRGGLINQVFSSVSNELAFIGSRSDVVAEVPLELLIVLERSNHRGSECIKILDLATINSLLRSLNDIASRVDIVTTIDRISVCFFTLRTYPLADALFINRGLFQGTIIGQSNLHPSNPILRAGLDRLFAVRDLNGNLGKLICGLGDGLRARIINYGKKVSCAQLHVSPTEHPRGLVQGIAQGIIGNATPSLGLS